MTGILIVVLVLLLLTPSEPSAIYKPKACKLHKWVVIEAEEGKTYIRCDVCHYRPGSDIFNTGREL